MAKNPMFGTAQNPNQSTAPSNKLNDSDKKYIRGRNKFDLSRPHHLTARYAEVTPIEVVEGVEGDILQFATHHNIRSYTLKSPLQTSIYMKKVYTQVDMKCILPKNWDKVYVNPTFGDDVPDEINCYYSKFFNDFCSTTRTINNYLLSQFRSDNPIDSGLTTLFFHNILLFEEIFSNGSLLSLLGFHTGSLRRFPVSVTPQSGSKTYTFQNFDEFFNFVYDFIRQNLKFDIAGVDSETIPDLIIFRECFDVFKHKLDTTFVVDDNDNNRTLLSTLAEVFSAVIPNFGSLSVPLNYGRCAAYQISCATFFSRDSVDNIYTSEKYLEAMTSFYSILSGQSPSALSLPVFDYNGVKCSADVLSGLTISKLLNSASYFASTLEDGSSLSDKGIGYFAFMRNLFGFQKNLRYGDYFVGSKPRPLAVGDVTTEVNNGAVNAIDMTVSLLRARFLNAVNRAGRRFSDYIREVMDGVAPPRDDEPRWLATVRSRVSGFEVENTTSENQGNIVTVLKSSDSNYIYELEVGTPCIIIGVCCFEVQRVYSRTVERFFMHANRFDMFNKFMQYSGDQGITLGEINANDLRPLSSSLNFAYTPRHMEYKQRYPIASGGYIHNLPGYVMITDNQNYESLGGAVFPFNLQINSDYIRMRNYEFDQFYSSLSGYGLADYFHFMIDCDCKCIAYRKMDKNPSIL